MLETRCLGESSFAAGSKKVLDADALSRRCHGRFFPRPAPSCPPSTPSTLSRIQNLHLRPSRGSLLFSYCRSSPDILRASPLLVQPSNTTQSLTNNLAHAHQNHFHTLWSIWLSSVLTKNSLTLVVTHPHHALQAPSEMIYFTGRQRLWVLVTLHTRAASSF